MPDKILVSDVIGVDKFVRDPAVALDALPAGVLVVLSNNAPLFYAVTPARMAQLLMLEQQVVAGEAVSEVRYDGAVLACAPVGKFAMYIGWQPDADFQRMAALWGVHLAYPVTAAELMAFVSYWQVERKVFHHIQWQQKLARNVQISRNGNGRRDVVMSSIPDEHIPAGFKG